MSTIENKMLMRLSLCCLLSAGPAWAQQMAAPIRQVTYEDVFKQGYSVPKWEQGFLVAWKMDTSSSDAEENLALYDGHGKLVGKTRIWFQDASFLRIEDAAARKDGNVAVVGWAVTSSGSHAAFLADVSVTRSSERIIQTSPFEGQAVGFGPDGTIWVLGLEVGPGRRMEAAPDHYMVQHFGTDDILKDQHLLRSDFHCELAIQINGVPRVVASGDRIGLFAPFCRMWLELSPAGEVLGQWKWNPRAPVSNGVEKLGGARMASVRSVTLTSGNELYGRSDWPKPHSLLRFDRQSGDWTPVGTSAAETAGAPFIWLEGSDGDTLVYGSVGKKLAWFKPDK